MGAGPATRVLAAAALGIALVGGCAATPAQPPAETPTSSVPAPTTAPPGTAGPRPVPGGPATAPVPVRDAGLDALVVAQPAPPVRVAYDRLGIDMPVDPVGVAADGAMEIPQDAARAGWYRFGPTVGDDTGTAVVASHAGSLATPRGPFYDLRDAAAGDRVRTVRGDGAETEYEVVAVERLSKATIDLSVYFRRDGDPRLVLVTCGGRWIEAAQSYEDNIVVTAILVGE